MSAADSYRRHIIIAGINPYVGSLEKDWFNYAWASSWLVRHVIARPQGEFHVVSNNACFTREQAIALVDNAITGKTRVMDLRQFAAYPNRLKNGRK